MIATDKNNVVVLVGSQLPNEFNGAALNLHETTPEQEAAYYALGAKSGATFDGSAFEVLPTPPAPITEKIAALEQAQPITQRSIRELMLAIGAAFPAAQASVFYKKAAAQEAEISSLRAQIK